MESRRRRYLIGIGGAVVVVAIAVVLSVIFLTGGEPEVPPIAGQQTEGDRPVTDKIWPATLVLHVPLDAATQADQPADVALLGGNMYLVDTAHGRLLEVSGDGTQFTVLDTKVDPQLSLATPMAITTDQGELYVADSDSGRVLVVDASGAVSRVISLERAASADALPPRPVGIAVYEDGSFVVSDANNNRLIRYDGDGKVIWNVGTGAADASDTGFNAPVGVALDNEGNVYVVDMYNSQIKKYSPDGQFISSFGQLGDQAGQFSRAKAIAVDDAGHVFVSDGLQAAVQVFDGAGTFLGFIGRADPDDPNSGSLFQAPHGLKIIDNKLYVVDRFNGLFVFALGASGPSTAPGSETTTTAAARDDTI